MQEKNELDSFFDLHDLQFEGEVDGVAAAEAGPVGSAGFHGDAEGFFLVKAACAGIAADHEFGETFGAPHAAKGRTTLLYPHCAETQAVDVHHGKVVTLFILVPQDIAWGEIQMQHTAIMHHRDETAQCLGNVLVGAFLRLAEFKKGVFQW